MPNVTRQYVVKGVSLIDPCAALSNIGQVCSFGVVPIHTNILLPREVAIVFNRKGLNGSKE